MVSKKIFLDPRKKKTQSVYYMYVCVCMNVCIYVGMCNKLVGVLEDVDAFLVEINTDTYMQSVCLG